MELAPRYMLFKLLTLLIWFILLKWFTLLTWFTRLTWFSFSVDIVYTVNMV